MPQNLKKSLLTLMLAGIALIARPQAPVVQGDIIAMLRPGVSAVAVAKDLSHVDGASAKVSAFRELSAPMRTWLFHCGPAMPPAEMLRAFQAHPGVELAQFNHIGKPRTVPNDANYALQWQHQNIHSEQAWDITTGGLTASGDTIVVAIIEDADLSHPDLAANAWINRGEIPGNGIDDDGNGYIDDVRGWDPHAGNDNVYSGPHGTEVAGMIGAVGDNGLQVVGANWHVKMMPVQYYSSEEADVIAAYTYPLVMRRLYNSTAGVKGAFIVATNASWGVDDGQPSQAPIWCAMYDTLGTAGILNCGATANNDVNVDVVGDLPTACPSDFMISVTATNTSDVRTFSGYGATTIDVGAPGQNIVTTAIGGGIATASGTSFASPLTAGVIALMYSAPCATLAALAHYDPIEAARRVRHALFEGVDHVGNLQGQTVTGGRIDSYNSLQWLMDSCTNCMVPYALTATSNLIGGATLTWSALPGTFDVRYRAVGTANWTEQDDITGNSISLSGLAVCQPYEFQVSAICDSGSSSFGPSLFWTSEGCCTAPVIITAEANDTSSATIHWSAVLASTTYDLRYRQLGSAAWIEQDGLVGTAFSITGLTSCSDNEVQLRSLCDGTQADWSASTVFHIPGCGQCIEGSFCSSSGGADQEWISHVKLAGIDRSSASDGGYASVEVTDQSTELVIGQSYPITLAPGYASSAFPEYFTVWMDLDRNGQFTTDELVFDAGHTVITALDSTLHVPAGATPGPVRLRVVMRYDSAVANGCTSYDYGETEDYCASLAVTAAVVEVHAGNHAVTIWPQPANDVVNFNTGVMGKQELMVMDPSGRLLRVVPFDGGFLTLRTQTLAEGIYVYQLRQSGIDRARGTFMVAH